VHSEIQNKIKELGKVLDPDLIDQTIRLYAPLLSKASRDGVQVTKDIPYGLHDRQKLDIYQPDQKGPTPLPMLIFVHGGGFVRGDKSENRNLGYYFARHGIVTLIPSYRLAPEHTWPSGANDVAEVIKLARQQGGQLNADMDHIFLMGHSAGAAHVASYLFCKDLRMKGQDGVVGGILLSCPVLDPENISKFEPIYYGTDASKYGQMSILHHLKGCNVPIFILVAEYDPPDFDAAAVKLVNALWEEKGVFPFFKKVCCHNHISEILQFNTDDPTIGPDILAFIRSRNHTP
jgi:acetyl esterase